MENKIKELETKLKDAEIQIAFLVAGNEYLTKANEVLEEEVKHLKYDVVLNEQQKNRQLMEEIRILKSKPKEPTTLKEALEWQAGGKHYKNLDLEPAFICSKNMSKEEFEGAIVWNINKYLWRKKGSRKEDMLKIKHYAEIFIAYLNER